MNELNFSTYFKLKTVYTRNYCGSSVNYTCACFVNIIKIKFVENYDRHVENS